MYGRKYLDSHKSFRVSWVYAKIQMKYVNLFSAKNVHFVEVSNQLIRYK